MPDTSTYIPAHYKRIQELAPLANGKKIIRKPHPKANEIITALYAADGLISQAAKKLRMNAYNLKKAIDSDILIQLEYKSIQAQLIDYAEMQLMSLIKKGNLGAICFYLKCKAKDRGYIERTETVTESNQKISIEVVKSVVQQVIKTPVNGAQNIQVIGNVHEIESNTNAPCNENRSVL